jgi:hypothetical protein
MIIQHHDLRLDLEDCWLVAAGAENFVRSSSAYIVDATSCNDRHPGLIRIDEIGPVLRAPGVPYFNGSAEEGLTAKERVIRILRAFANGVALPPVEVVRTSSDSHPFKLFDGTHRLYLSLAVGYTHIPAVERPDLADW